MAQTKAFNSVVAARTRAAQKISCTGDLLSKVEAAGGLKADLDEMARLGREAESLNHAQGTAGTNGKIATQAVRDALLALKKEYAAVMAVLTALKPQFANQRDVLVQIVAILKNEAQTGFSTQAIIDADGKPASKRVARRLVSQEAVRAEIWRDATALLAFTEIASALEARKVTKARLQKLQADAAALSGMISSRALSASEKKIATAQETAAVAAQRTLWGAYARLLYSLAETEPVIAGLLAGTTENARK